MEKWESNRGRAEELKNRNANLRHTEHNHPEKTSSSYNRFRGIVEEYESPHDYVPNKFNNERYKVTSVATDLSHFLMKGSIS